MNIFYAKSIGGEIKWDNNKAISDYLASVDGKKIMVTVDREKSKRSLNQNAYYWNYLRLVANDTGHTEYELHSLFKRIFLPPMFIKVLGREIKLPATTKKLSKVDFGEYLDKISAETNIPLPDPKDIQNLIALNYPQEKHNITAF